MRFKLKDQLFMSIKAYVVVVDVVVLVVVVVVVYAQVVY